MADLLALYRDAQPLVTSRVLDLDRSPGEAERLGVSDYNVVVLESAGRRERVDIVNEEALTAALLRRRRTPPSLTAYVVQGHGEPTHATTTSAAAAARPLRALEARRLRRPPAARGAARIPEDAGLVVLAGPTRELHAGGESTRSSLGAAAAADCSCSRDPDAPRSLAALLAPLRHRARRRPGRRRARRLCSAPTASRRALPR